MKKSPFLSPQRQEGAALGWAQSLFSHLVSHVLTTCWSRSALSFLPSLFPGLLPALVLNKGSAWL